MRAQRLHISGSVISVCICALLGASIRTAHADGPPVIEYFTESPTYPHAGAYAVSADGNTIVGSYYIGSASRVFIWTPTGGMTDLGTFGGVQAEAAGVSADGRIVVGSVQYGTVPGLGTWHAFRWSAEDGFQDLGALDSSVYTSFAYAISADGLTVVGSSETDDYESFGHAVRWTPSQGIQDLGTAGRLHSGAYGVSADGSVICGVVESTAHGPANPCVWKAGTAHVLGTLGGNRAHASAVSGDGRVVAGLSKVVGSNDNYLFRWTEEDGMTSLGSTQYTGSRGVSTTFDGSVIVGWGGFAYFWTQDLGIRDLNAYLRQRGTDLDGGEVRFLRAITPDGSVIVGAAYHDGQYRAFRLTNMSYDRPDCPIDYNGTGDSGDVLDLFDFLDDFGACELQPAPCGTIGNADFNADGIVDILDFLDFLDGFGRGC